MKTSACYLPNPQAVRGARAVGHVRAGVGVDLVLELPNPELLLVERKDLPKTVFPGIGEATVWELGAFLPTNPARPSTEPVVLGDGREIYVYPMKRLGAAVAKTKAAAVEKMEKFPGLSPIKLSRIPEIAPAPYTVPGAKAWRVESPKMPAMHLKVAKNLEDLGEAARVARDLFGPIPFLPTYESTEFRGNPPDAPPAWWGNYPEAEDEWRRLMELERRGRDLGGEPDPGAISQEFSKYLDHLGLSPEEFYSYMDGNRTNPHLPAREGQDPDVVYICSWCPDAEELTAEAAAAGKKTSHGLCDACQLGMERQVDAIRENPPEVLDRHISPWWERMKHPPVQPPGIGNRPNPKQRPFVFSFRHVAEEKNLGRIRHPVPGKKGWYVVQWLGPQIYVKNEPDDDVGEYVQAKYLLVHESKGKGGDHVFAIGQHEGRLLVVARWRGKAAEQLKAYPSSKLHPAVAEQSAKAILTIESIARLMTLGYYAAAAETPSWWRVIEGPPGGKAYADVRKAIEIAFGRKTIDSALDYLHRRAWELYAKHALPEKRRALTYRMWIDRIAGSRDKMIAAGLAGKKDPLVEGLDVSAEDREKVYPVEYLVELVMVLEGAMAGVCSVPGPWKRKVVFDAQLFVNSVEFRYAKPAGAVKGLRLKATKARAGTKKNRPNVPAAQIYDLAASGLETAIRGGNFGTIYHDWQDRVDSKAKKPPLPAEFKSSVAKGEELWKLHQEDDASWEAAVLRALYQIAGDEDLQEVAREYIGKASTPHQAKHVFASGNLGIRFKGRPGWSATFYSTTAGDPQAVRDAPRPFLLTKRAAARSKDPIWIVDGGGAVLARYQGAVSAEHRHHGKFGKDVEDVAHRFRVLDPEFRAFRMGPLAFWEAAQRWAYRGSGSFVLDLGPITEPRPFDPEQDIRNVYVSELANDGTPPGYRVAVVSPSTGKPFWVELLYEFLEKPAIARARAYFRPKAPPAPMRKAFMEIVAMELAREGKPARWSISKTPLLPKAKGAAIQAGATSTLSHKFAEGAMLELPKRPKTPELEQTPEFLAARANPDWRPNHTWRWYTKGDWLIEPVSARAKGAWAKKGWRVKKAADGDVHLLFGCPKGLWRDGLCAPSKKAIAAAKKAGRKPPQTGLELVNKKYRRGSPPWIKHLEEELGDTLKELRALRDEISTGGITTGLALQEPLRRGAMTDVWFRTAVMVARPRDLDEAVSWLNDHAKTDTRRIQILIIAQNDPARALEQLGKGDGKKVDRGAVATAKKVKKNPAGAPRRTTWKLSRSLLMPIRSREFAQAARTWSWANLYSAVGEMWPTLSFDPEWAAKRELLYEQLRLLAVMPELATDHVPELWKRLGLIGPMEFTSSLDYWLAGAHRWGNEPPPYAADELLGNGEPWEQNPQRPGRPDLALWSVLISADPESKRFLRALNQTTYEQIMRMIWQLKQAFLMDRVFPKGSSSARFRWHMLMARVDRLVEEGRGPKDPDKLRRSLLDERYRNNPAELLILHNPWRKGKCEHCGKEAPLSPSLYGVASPTSEGQRMELCMKCQEADRQFGHRHFSCAELGCGPECPYGDHRTNPRARENPSPVAYEFAGALTRGDTALAVDLTARATWYDQFDGLRLWYHQEKERGVQSPLEPFQENDAADFLLHSLFYMAAIPLPKGHLPDVPQTWTEAAARETEDEAWDSFVTRLVAHFESRPPRRNPERRRAPGEKEKHRKAYEEFHGTEPMELIEIPDGKVPAGVPTPLIALGQLDHIGYQVPGHSGKAGRSNTPFRHYFGEVGEGKNPKVSKERRPWLATDAAHKHLFIVGGKFKVEPRGIVG